MGYKRIHIRVPLTGKATLAHLKDGIHFTAKTINISAGGVAVSDTSMELQEGEEYQITVTTNRGDRIQLTAMLLRYEGNNAGFKTTEIGKEDLNFIKDMVDEYQTTPEFIDQLTEHDMLQQNYIDDEGNELEVTFDIDP